MIKDKFLKSDIISILCILFVVIVLSITGIKIAGMVNYIVNMNNILEDYKNIIRELYNNKFLIICDIFCIHIIKNYI